MYLHGAWLNFAFMMIYDGEDIRANGMLHGYTWLTWAVRDRRHPPPRPGRRVSGPLPQRKLSRQHHAHTVQPSIHATTRVELVDLPRCEFTSQLCAADVTTLCFGTRRSVR